MDKAEREKRWKHLEATWRMTCPRCGAEYRLIQVFLTLPRDFIEAPWCPCRKVSEE